MAKKYYSIRKFGELLGVSSQTLRNWDRNGKLHPHHVSDNGYRYYSEEQLNLVRHIPKPNRITVGYCRMSCSTKTDF